MSVINSNPCTGTLYNIHMYLILPPKKRLRHLPEYRPEEYRGEGVEVGSPPVLPVSSQDWRPAVGRGCAEQALYAPWIHRTKARTGSP